jgi:uncharacterized membrane protein
LIKAFLFYDDMNILLIFEFDDQWLFINNICEQYYSFVIENKIIYFSKVHILFNKSSLWYKTLKIIHKNGDKRKLCQCRVNNQSFYSDAFALCLKKMYDSKKCI